MSKRVLMCFAAAMLACAAPAAAQTSPPPLVAARSPDYDARVLLVRRYLEVIQFDKLMNAMLDSMTGAMFADDRIPEGKRELMRGAATDAFAIVMPQMMEANVELYANSFTLAELQQLVDFYASPVGRSIMTKTVMLSRESGEMMTRFMPIMQGEMMRQLCARTECPAEQATANSVKRP